MKLGEMGRKLSQWWNADGLDDTFLESYRKVLFGQYMTLGPSENDAAARKEAEEIVKMDPDDIDWDDLYRLELAIIKLEPEASLRRRAWILRNEYREMALSDEYKDYLASNPPDVRDSTIALLRADLVQLQQELNWRYIVTWVLETYRSLLLVRLVRWTLGVVLIALGLVFWGTSVAYIASWTNLNLPFLEATVLPGIIGGLMSTVRRIQSVRFGSNADLDLSQLEQGNTSVYLSPFLGGIFALVLFFLFASGYMIGDFFPKVTLEHLTVDGLESLELKETAKLIVWSFLAGFAEKLVPDRLERLTQSSNQSAVAGRNTPAQ